MDAIVRNVLGGCLPNAVAARNEDPQPVTVASRLAGGRCDWVVQQQQQRRCQQAVAATAQHTMQKRDGDGDGDEEVDEDDFPKNNVVGCR